MYYVCMYVCMYEDFEEYEEHEEYEEYEEYGESAIQIVCRLYLKVLNIGSAQVDFRQHVDNIQVGYPGYTTDCMYVATGRR